MADISITAANVAIVEGTKVTDLDVVQLGETTTAGQTLYKKAADGKYWLADANASAATAQVTRLALQGGAADDWRIVLKPGNSVTIGATLVATDMYNQSVNPGGIAPTSDMASTSYHTPLGRAISTTVMYFDPQPTGVQKA